jgi:hypothetical protein
LTSELKKGTPPGLADSLFPNPPSLCSEALQWAKKRDASRKLKGVTLNSVFYIPFLLATDYRLLSSMLNSGFCIPYSAMCKKVAHRVYSVFQIIAWLK